MGTARRRDSPSRHTNPYEFIRLVVQVDGELWVWYLSPANMGPINIDIFRGKFHWDLSFFEKLINIHF